MLMQLKNLALISLSLLITGCTLGPDYKRPDIVMPAHYITVLKEGKKTRYLHYSAWWQAFQDPELSSLIEIGIGQNLNLAQARARILSQRADTNLTNTNAWPPRIDLNLSAMHYTQSLVALQRRNPFLIPATWLYSVSALPSWEVDFFGGFKREREAANDKLDQTILDAASNQVSLAANIAKEYTHFREIQNSMDLQLALIKTDTDILHLDDNRYRAGLIDESTVKSDAITMAEAESDFTRMQYELKSSLFSIDELIGQAPNTAANELLIKTKPIPHVKIAPKTGLPSTLLEQRPDILAAEKGLAEANANIGVAIAEYFPKFNLTNNYYGQQSTTIPDLFKTSANYSSLGPLLDWKIFDFWRIKYDVAKNKGLAKEALLNYKETIITALKEVDTDLITYAKQKNRLIDSKKIVADNEAKENLANHRYQSGMTDYIQVLREKQSVLTAEQNTLTSEQDLTDDYISLSEALGGGWESGDNQDRPLPTPFS